MGMIPLGAGFWISKEQAEKLGRSRIAGLANHIRPYVNGKDLTGVPRGILALDFFGLSEEKVKLSFPEAYQWILERVKPQRQQDNRESRRRNWWIFAESVPKFRNAACDLARYIGTTETAKHRLFSYISAEILPDQKVRAIALNNQLHFGVLSSRMHVIWANSVGSRMGVGNDPVYNNTRCFETFPFPDAPPEQQAQIRELADRLDAHRKRQQALHPELTLTGMYNVLEKLRSGEPLNAKDKTIHEQGLVSLLRELHDELDRAVFAAYGWDDLAEQLVGKPGATTPLPDKPETQAEAEEELLCRLVALNAERAAEEARGLVRWLRPEYQNPSAAVAPEQSEADLGDTTDFESVPAATAAPGKLTWPKQMREQVAAVRHALSQSPLPADALAAQFKRSPKVAVQAVLDALEELGMVAQENAQYRLAS